MFDIGFWELCLIAVVALLVFGPEKLPGAARTAGLWIGRARRVMNTIKQDIDREIQIQEMRDAVKNSNENVHEFIEEAQTGLNQLKKPISLDPSQSDGKQSASPSSNTSTSTKTS
jgi:sec-independent protein translocase protein TatB